MRPFITTLLLFFTLSSLNAQSIIINEFSQGNAGSAEWVELIVLSDGEDIRGVYFTDDEAGFGIAPGFFQLSLTNPIFASVPAGATILVYNNSQKDTNLPADDTDFSDNTIIIPNNNATFLEAGGSWGGGLSNSGEDFGIFSASNVGIHGISYGSGTPTTDFDTNFGMADLSSAVGAGNSAYFTEDTGVEAGNGGNWTEQSAAAATPSANNGGNNNNIMAASPQVPTLSEWGLINLALLLMTVGTLSIVQMRTELE